MALAFTTLLDPRTSWKIPIFKWMISGRKLLSEYHKSLGEFLECFYLLEVLLLLDFEEAHLLLGLAQNAIEFIDFVFQEDLLGGPELVPEAQLLLELMILLVLGLVALQ